MGSDEKAMKPIKQWTFASIVEFAKGVDKRMWMAIGVGAVAFLLIFVFLVIPAWIERPMFRQQVQSMEAQIRQVKSLDQKRLLWEENQKVFGDLIKETQSRVFTVEERGLLLGQISKMAQESRVDVLASKPTADKVVFPAPYHLKYQPSGYEFTVQGGYHDLGSFVSRLENSGKLLRVQSIQITPSDKSPERHIAQLKLWAILSAPSAAAPVAGTNHVKK